MNTRYILAAGSLLAATIAATPAAAGLLTRVVDPAAEAAKSNFTMCDGYGAPAGKGDGITTNTWLFGLAKGEFDIRPGAINAIAQKGIDACNAALADPLLLPAFTVRRAHLMQARAFHQISGFAYEDALRTLDEIDAMRGSFDPVLFDRGMGLGNRLLRAFVLVDQGRKADAVALIDAIDRDRAFAAGIRATTEQLRYRLDPDLGHQLERMKAMAPTMPGMAVGGFLFALEDARMDDAVALGAAVSFDRPEMKGQWRMEGAAMSDYEQIMVEAMYAGAYAYALHATGRKDEAKAVVAGARSALDKAMAPPPPRADGKPLSKSIQSDFAMRSLFGKRGAMELDRWQALVALRDEARELSLVDLSQRLSAMPQGSVPVVIDLIQQTGRATGAEKGGVLQDLREQQRQGREKKYALDLLKLIDRLPRPETAAAQVKLKKAGDGYFLSDNGFSMRQGGDDPTDWTVRFTHALASGPTLEEHVVLAAARAVRERGYDSFLIQHRQTFERTTHISGMWVGSYDQNSGREAQLRIRMVHKDALPADLAAAGWRLLDADRVIAALEGLPHR